MARAFKSKEEAVQYLNTLPISQMIDLAAELLMERQPAVKKILITEEQFKTLFRIVGQKDDGTTETRGRRKKTTEENLFSLEEV